MAIANDWKEIFHDAFFTNNRDLDLSSVLVHLFEGRIFRVVESSYVGTDRQRRDVVFSCFFYLAKST